MFKATTQPPHAGGLRESRADKQIPVSAPGRALERFRVEIRAAIDRVLGSGRFIGGAEVEAFEAEFAAYLGVKHAVGVASGTDALELALRACGIGPGDAVATASLTAVATVAAIERAGAAPVLVEIDPVRLAMDPAALARACERVPVKVVIPVHLHGQPANMPELLEVASRGGMAVVEDCAQAHGARLQGRCCGTFGAVGAFSFYPTKNLGALGDAGAVVTNDAAIADRLRMLRQYGWRERNVSEACGINSRLDPIQAAVLRVKLRTLDVANARRREIARRYDEALGSTPIHAPARLPGAEHVYHQYVVRTTQREALRRHLADLGIGTAVHYEQPVHLQPAYIARNLTLAEALPKTETACSEILSVPVFPELSNEEIGRVADALASFDGVQGRS